MDERPNPVDPEFYIKDNPWRDYMEQQDWLKRWDVQPANDARYLPTFPDAETQRSARKSGAIGAIATKTLPEIRFNNTRRTMPQPQLQRQQSYADFVGATLKQALQHYGLDNANPISNASSGLFSGLVSNQQPSQTHPLKRNLRRL